MKSIYIAIFILAWLGISWGLSFLLNLEGWIGILLFLIGSSAIFSYQILPFIISRMHSQNFLAPDMNKKEKPKVAQFGGIAIFFAFSLGITFAIFFHSFLPIATFKFELSLLFAGFTTILLVAFLGVFDDLIGWTNGIRQYQHALVPVFAALPLMAIQAGTTTMALPIIGQVDFGIFYALILIPIGVTGAANALNMLAGLNGLEAGLGIILTSTLLLLSVLENQIESAIIMAALLGALIGFLKYNWFPAKIFPGDATTLMVGASIAVASIIGNFERLGILLLFLFFIELILKSRTKFQVQSFGIPQKGGWLKAPPKIGSLTHVIMRRGQFSEKQVVLIILGLQIIISAIVLGYWYLNSIEFFRILSPWVIL
ncbi:hypothetical protein KKE06_03345 [Candidatus Micrarchaeota archaeon]|nr:hypothetical protein [Candidatus Micrarchaeota archaeon]MBU1930209.1 hypothetical protein [Candidatus Micrarchaeota archaeon]